MTFRTISEPYIPTDPDNIAEFGASLETPSVDYFTFGKTSNYTGARITSFSLELLDADGNLMGTLDPENAVLFLTEGLDPKVLGGAGLPDGLFGEGGNEGDIGFFSGDKANPTIVTRTGDITNFEGMSSGGDNVYGTFFGDAFLDDTMVPDGLFWDDNDDPTDESALVAWNNIGGAGGVTPGWTYGTLALDADIPARLQELADALGVVDPADLDYEPGGSVPEDIVALAEANGLFEVGAIEDLRNANLNFTIRVGSIDAGEFILRISPKFEPIVSETTSEYQFRTAGYLDALANVPYLDTGNAGDYAALISDIFALDAAAQANALEETGFSFLSAYSGLGMTLGREQVFALGMPAAQSGADGTVMASQGADNFWAMGGGISGMAAINGSSGTFESTANGVGYDVDTTGFSAGVAYDVSPTAAVGVLLGASQATAEAMLDRGKIETDAITGAVFARAVFGDGGAVQAMLGYQDLSLDSERNVGAETATGSTDGSQTFFAVRGDYMFGQGALRYGPTAAFETYSLSVDAYDETGLTIGNLSIGDQDNDITIASIGLRSTYDFGAGNAYGSVAYTNVSGDDSMVTTGFVGEFAGLTPVDGMDQNWVDVGVGFSTRISDTAMLGGEYRGSFGDDYESHGVRAFVSMEF